MYFSSECIDVLHIDIMPTYKIYCLMSYILNAQNK